MGRIQVTLAPEPERVRMLATGDERRERSGGLGSRGPERVRMLATGDEGDVLKAVLGPVHACHPRAGATMLEGLALWHQRPLSVVLCADDSGHSSALALYDALGAGMQTLHYEVAVAFHPSGHRRRRSLQGLGDFRDLRQLALPGVLR